MTNFEKFKAMTVEELANFFEKYTPCGDETLCTGHCLLGCAESHKKWLEREADDEAE
jgi:hypothetical protein